MSRLARPRHRIEAPLALAGVGVVSVNEPAHAVLAAGNANHDQILHRQRRHREAVSRCDNPPRPRPTPRPRSSHRARSRAHPASPEKPCRPESPARDSPARSTDEYLPESAAGTSRWAAPCAHRAQTRDHPAPVAYRIPSTTSGVVSSFPVAPVWYTHFATMRARIGDVDLIEPAEALSGIVARSKSSSSAVPSRNSPAARKSPARELIRRGHQNREAMPNSDRP